MKKEPYLIKERIVVERHYNPEYGDDLLCRCGHAYYRHFDTYEDMYACGCKYCGCYTFTEGATPVTEEYVEPAIGSMSLVGVHGKAPHAHANYFWLTCGSRVLNFWAENLTAAAKQFNMEQVKIRRYKGEDYDVCLIDDGRIPEEWYLKELCFTGSHIPPIEVLKDIFHFGDTNYISFKNDLEKFTDPASYYAKKGWGYHPEAGVVSIPVNATARKLSVNWTIEERQPMVTVLTEDAEEELEKIITDQIAEESIEVESPPELVIAKMHKSKILTPPSDVYIYAPHIPNLTPQQWDAIRKQIETFKKENEQ